METEYYSIIKLLFVGDSNCGKSSIIKRECDNIYGDDGAATIGIDFRFKTLFVRDKVVKVQIWDTAGQERFRTITKSYYSGANGIFLVFDLTNRESFMNIKNWLSEIDKHCDEKIKKILLGNKGDDTSSRQIEFYEANTFAELHNMTYIETSAKSGININEAFITIITEIDEKLKKDLTKKDKGVMKMFNSSHNNVFVEFSEDRKRRCCY